MIKSVIFIEVMRRGAIALCDKTIDSQRDRFENPRINTPVEMIGQVFKLIVLSLCGLFVLWIFFNLFLMAIGD